MPVMEPGADARPSTERRSRSVGCLLLAVLLLLLLVALIALFWRSAWWVESGAPLPRGTSVAPAQELDTAALLCHGVLARQGRAGEIPQGIAMGRQIVDPLPRAGSQGREKGDFA